MPVTFDVGPTDETLYVTTVRLVSRRHPVFHVRDDLAWDAQDATPLDIAEGLVRAVADTAMLTGHGGTPDPNQGRVGLLGATVERRDAGGPDDDGAAAHLRLLERDGVAHQRKLALVVALMDALTARGLEADDHLWEGRYGVAAAVPGRDGIGNMVGATLASEDAATGDPRWDVDLGNCAGNPRLGTGLTTEEAAATLVGAARALAITRGLDTDRS